MNYEFTLAEVLMKLLAAVKYLGDRCVASQKYVLLILIMRKRKKKLQKLLGWLF